MVVPRIVPLGQFGFNVDIHSLFREEVSIVRKSAISFETRKNLSNNFPACIDALGKRGFAFVQSTRGNLNELRPTPIRFRCSLRQHRRAATADAVLHRDCSKQIAARCFFVDRDDARLQRLEIKRGKIVAVSLL